MLALGLFQLGALSGVSWISPDPMSVGCSDRTLSLQLVTFAWGSVREVLANEDGRRVVSLEEFQVACGWCATYSSRK